MATPFPNPEEARKKKPGGPRRTRATPPLLAPPPTPHVPTKISVDQHAIPGPSGIKQCYRTVKSVRRIPILQNPNPPPPPNPPIPLPAKKQNQHTCKQCHKKFNSPGKLSQHTLSHTGELPFTCHKCDKKFNSKFKLVRHGLIHNETRPFSCSSCCKTFHRKDHLVNHERTHNPAKIPYKCTKDDCNKQYTSLLSYKKHQALHSAEEGNLECKICYKVFENKADIVYHLKVHAGSRTVKNENDKKFKCTMCDRKFFTGKDVRRHLVVHTGSRDFHCQFCRQEFGRKDHLVRHVKKAHPTETLQSTPGTSTATPAVPPTHKVTALTTRKGKGEGKKTKIKTETSEAQPSEELIIKTEQIPVLETSNIFQLDTQQQSPMFISCSETLEIKSEPFPEDIKIEETLIYESLPSTSKDIPTFVVPHVDPQPSTALGRYDDVPILPYMMPTYTDIPPIVEIIPEDKLPYISPPELVFSVLEDPKDIFEKPMESILIEGEESEFQGQQQQEQQKTVLPTFKDAFPSSAQSPRPPQDPPK